jgi:hypothetical protein
LLIIIFIFIIIIIHNKFSEDWRKWSKRCDWCAFSNRNEKTCTIFIVIKITLYFHSETYNIQSHRSSQGIPAQSSVHKNFWPTVSNIVHQPTSMSFFFYIARIKVSKSSPTDFVHEMTIPEVVTVDVTTDVETFTFNLRRNRWHTRNIPVFTGEGNTWHSYIFDIQKVSICREDACYTQ